MSGGGWTQCRTIEFSLLIFRLYFWKNAVSVYNIETITLVKISVLVYIKEILSMIYQTKIRLPITSCYFAKSGVWVFFVIHWRLMHGICVQKPFTGNSHWISSPIDPFFHSVGSRDLSLGVREFDPSSNTGRVMVPSYSTLQLLFIDGVKCLYRAYHSQV